MFIFYLICLINLNKSKADSALLDTPIYRLQTNLLNGYNSDIRPVRNFHSTINITINFSLIQVILMNDQQETLTLSGYLNIEWIDEYMKWNPLDYDNISKITMPQEKIWTPDIFLYNAADKDSWNQWSTSYILVRLDSNGSCYVTPPSLLITNCKLDVEDFPFDEKFCEMKFGSWMYHSNQIRLISDPTVILTKYIDSNQTVSDEIYDGLGGIYSIFTVHLHFRRRTLFFSFNLILPSIIIALCSIFGFILPPESGEKVGLQITNLLSVVFFIQYISTIVPPSSMGVAKISIYFFTTSILCMLSLMGNILVLDLHNRDIRVEKDMPIWLEKVVLFLGKLTFSKKMKFDIENTHFEEEFTNQKTSKIKLTKKDDLDLQNPEENSKVKNEIVLNLERINDTLMKLWNTIDQKSIEEIKEIKWKYAAIVLDRLFFFLSLAYFLLTFCPFLLSIKNFYKPQ